MCSPVAGHDDDAGLGEEHEGGGGGEEEEEEEEGGGGRKGGRRRRRRRGTESIECKSRLFYTERATSLLQHHCCKQRGCDIVTLQPSVQEAASSKQQAALIAAPSYTKHYTASL